MQPFNKKLVVIFDLCSTFVQEIMKGTSIGEFEELVLLAVGIQHNEAYGFSITEELEKQTGRTINMRAVHTALYRLEEKGLVQSQLGGATKERGGRRKRLFGLTPNGRTAIIEMREARDKLWSLIPKVVIEGKL